MKVVTLRITVLVAGGATLLLVALSVLPIGGPSADVAVFRSYYTPVLLLIALLASIAAVIQVILFRRDISSLDLFTGLAPLVALVLLGTGAEVAYRMDPRNSSIPHLLSYEIRSAEPTLDGVHIKGIQVHSDLAFSGQGFPEGESLRGSATYRDTALIFGADERVLEIQLPNRIFCEVSIPVPQAPSPMSWTPWLPPSSAVKVFPSGKRQKRELKECPLQARFMVELSEVP